MLHFVFVLILWIQVFYCTIITYYISHSYLCVYFVSLQTAIIPPLKQIFPFFVQTFFSFLALRSNSHLVSSMSNWSVFCNLISGSNWERWLFYGFPLTVIRFCEVGFHGGCLGRFVSVPLRFFVSVFVCLFACFIYLIIYYYFYFFWGGYILARWINKPGGFGY